MSASDHLSPKQLLEHATKFHDEHLSGMGLHHKENAEGECDTCTDMFNTLSGLPNVNSRWYMRPDTKWNHVVSEVPTTKGPHIVDFTYRQFHQGSPFPLVEPVERYEQRRHMRKYEKTEGWKAMGFSRNPFEDEE